MPRSIKPYAKRKFRGNQHIAQLSEFPTKPSDCESLQATPKPSSTTTDHVSPQSSSKKKLGYLSLELDNNLDSSSNKVVVDLKSLSQLISSMCKCKFCGFESEFEVAENEEKRQGISTSIAISQKTVF